MEFTRNQREFPFIIGNYSNLLKIPFIISNLLKITGIYFICKEFT